MSKGLQGKSFYSPSAGSQASMELCVEVEAVCRAQHERNMERATDALPKLFPTGGYIWECNEVPELYK